MIFENILKYPRNKTDRVIIIGSGPAGISLAIELEKKNIKSTILEAGEFDYSDESQQFYKTEVIGDHLVDAIEYTRLRMFGGTSVHWGGTCRTLDEYDFKNWPITKKDLDPYITRSAKILDIKEPNFRETNVNENFKIVEFQNSIDSKEPELRIPVNFGEKYKAVIQNSKNIDLILNSPVTKIIGNNDIAQKIEIHFLDKKINLSGNKYVLATGGIENSRILLWSRQNNNNFINKNLPIGNFWYTHPFHVLGKGFTNKKKIKEYFKNDLNEFYNMFGWGVDTKTFNISPTKKFMSENNILNSCLFITLHDRKNDDLKDIVKNFLCFAPEISKKLVKKFEKTLYCGTTFSSAWEQNPDYNNRIELSEKFDNFGVPFTKIFYKKDKIVRKTAKIMMEGVAKLLIEKDLGRVNISEFLLNDKQYETDGGGQHHLGGTIMGNNYKTSVVDRNLKLHSAKNLYVLGSSVYPSGGHANPTFTIVQLSCRLADEISNNFYET